MPTREVYSGMAAPERAEPSRGSRDTIDLHQLWSTLKHHYRFVFVVASIVFAGVMTLTLVSRMRFRAVARLYLGELEEGAAKSGSRSKEEIDLSASAVGVVGSETEIIQSRTLVTKAILDSGLNVGITALGEPSPRYGQWLVSHRDPHLLDVGAQELRARNARLLDPGSRKRVYALHFVSNDSYVVRLDDGRTINGKLGEVAQFPGASLELDAGDVRKPRPGAEYSVVIRPLTEVTDEALLALQVSAPKPSPQAPPVNVLTLEFRDASPRLAASFLDRLIAAYLDERQEWKVEDASAAEAFVSRQLDTIRTSLDDIQRKLADYRTNNRVVVMDNEAKAMIEQIGKYEEQRVAARLETSALSEIQRTLKGPNPPVGAFLLGEAQDTVLEGMANSLTVARQKLTDLESRFNDAAPEVKDQRAQVDAQLDAIRNYVSSRAARAQGSLGTLDSIIGQFEARLKTVPGAELGLVQLSRESEVYNRTYSYLLERQQQAAIIKASTLSKNRVLDAPQVAYHEDSPKLLLRLASAPLGLLLGVALVLARSFLSSTFQRENDARAFAEGFPIFASVPRRVRRRGERRGLQGPGSFDVLGADTGSTFTEAFRTLRTNLYRTGSRGTGRVILLTSPSPADGKTTCALALAAALAADGRSVLLVDADLRKPNQPAPPGPYDVHAPGLASVLRGEQAFSDVLRLAKLPFGHFFALSSGASAPPELLSSGSLEEFLEDARRRFDFVLLDAPSFPTAADALVLAPLTDCVLSVLRLENTSRKAALEHVRGITLIARSYAIVLNDVGISRQTMASSPELVSAPSSRPLPLSVRKRSSTGTPAPSSPKAS